MSNITYTEAKIVENKQNPEKAPWLALGYMDGKRTGNLTFGSKKAYFFLKELDKMNDALSKWNVETDGLFKYELTLDAGTKYQSVVELTREKVLLISHYEKDIGEYLKQYPFVQFKHELITKPIVKTEEVGLDYVKVLYIPVYPKGENDEGEGMVARKFTQKSAKFLFEKVFMNEGGAIARFKKAIQNGEKSVTFHFISMSGKESDTEYDEDFMKAVLQYKEVIMSFIISGNIME